MCFGFELRPSPAGTREALAQMEGALAAKLGSVTTALQGSAADAQQAMQDASQVLALLLQLRQLEA